MTHEPCQTCNCREGHKRYSVSKDVTITFPSGFRRFVFTIGLSVMKGGNTCGCKDTEAAESVEETYIDP